MEMAEASRRTPTEQPKGRDPVTEAALQGRAGFYIAVLTIDFVAACFFQVRGKVAGLGPTNAATKSCELGSRKGLNYNTWPGVGVM